MLLTRLVNHGVMRQANRCPLFARQRAHRPAGTEVFFSHTISSRKTRGSFHKVDELPLSLCRLLVCAGQIQKAVGQFFVLRDVQLVLYAQLGELIGASLHILREAVLWSGIKEAGFHLLVEPCVGVEQPSLPGVHIHCL